MSIKVAENKNQKNIGITEIVGGAIAGIGSHIAGTAASYTKHMKEYGFANGESITGVKNQIKTYAQNIHKLENNIPSPSEFFNIDIDKDLGQFKELSALKYEKYNLENKVKAIDEAIAKDMPLIVGGALIAAVAVGAGIYYFNQHLSKPDKHQLTEATNEGNLVYNEQKKIR